MTRTILLLIILAVFPIFGYATHIVGGEITYQCEGYNANDDTYTYTITLTVYNDCGPANVNNTFFDDLASIGIFEGNDLYETLLIDYPGGFTLIDTELNNPCVTIPISACVRKAVYESSVDLSFENGGYDVVYQRCCRNWSISNINNAGTTGMTLHAYIPEPIDSTCNNSPIFDVLPPSFLCNNYDFELDFSASDADGDSLVYSLCTPFWGASVDIPQPSPPDSPPFFNISWASGYNASDPFSTVNGLILDSQTGFLTGMPNEIGIFAVAICVKEYRDGVLLSEVYRDYQINIYNCPSVIESVFAEQQADDLCSGLEILFENTSSNSSNFFWDFGIDGIESDTSNVTEPTFIFPNPGAYTVTLIAEPGGDCADTSYQTYVVENPISAFFENPTISCDTFTTFSFLAQGDYTGPATFQWNFGNSQTSTLENPGEITFPGPGSYNVYLTVQASGCLSNFVGQVDIPENVNSEIVPQSEFCDGLEITFENASTNAQSFQWIIGDPGDQFYSTAISPTVTFNNEGVYPATLIAYNDLACPDTSIQFFEVFPYMMPYFEVPQDVYCFDGHEINLLAEGTYQDDALIEWNFGANASQIFSNDILTSDITYSEPGIYPVTLSIFENGCEKNYTQNVEIHPNPLAKFIVLDSTGCKPLNVQFINISEAWTPMQYQWNFDNGSFSIDESPSTDYYFSGSFYPSLTVSTSSGCIDENSYTLEWPIHVFPLPQANFTVEPNIVDILDPQVYISDYSQNAISVYYDISNGDTINQTNFSYVFDNAGLFEITQTVFNEYGCFSQITGGVKVNGFLFFMPNSFTPNGDGYNDILIPEFTGVLEYSLQIYDRWGQLIFQSYNPFVGWDGNNTQEGVFTYLVKLTDLTKLPHHYNGTITLIR